MLQQLTNLIAVLLRESRSLAAKENEARAASVGKTRRSTEVKIYRSRAHLNSTMRIFSGRAASPPGSSRVTGIPTVVWARWASSGQIR